MFFFFFFINVSLNNGVFIGSLGVVYWLVLLWGICVNFFIGFCLFNVDDIGKVFDFEFGFVVVFNFNLGVEYVYNVELGFFRVIGDGI